MEHALQLPNPRRSVATLLVAALLGAGVATTIFALADGEKASPSKVVTVRASGSDSEAQPTPAGGPRP